MTHPSVPERTPWMRLGAFTTDTAMVAFVDPAMAGVLGDTWAARYLNEDGEPIQRTDSDPVQEHEVVEFEEVQLGDGDVQAFLAAVHADGAWVVEGRFIEGDGRTELTDLRIRLWECECTCHGQDEDGPAACEGDCHNADPN